jgi:hypothetical protein
MKDIIKSLKDLGLEIANSDETVTKDWLNKTAKLYEQLLLADYLEKRKASLNAIEDQLIEKVGQVIDSDPIEIKTPEAPSQKLKGLGDEIRTVPVPQGPPTNFNQKSIYDEPDVYVEEEVIEKPKPIKEEIIVETKPEAKEAPAEIEKKKPLEKESKVSIAEKAATAPKKSLNDVLSGSALKFGLNDRIAFVKHLFNGSQEDFNRVVSQLNTFTNQQEALDFVEHIVKPEYNWKSKQEFADRFMESLENRFA